MKKWTTQRLLHEMEELLRRKDTTIKYRVLSSTRCSARSTFGDGKMVHIVLDPSQVGLGPGVLHELLHVVLRHEMERFGKGIEEKIIFALEEDLLEEIRASKRRMALWRRRIKERSVP